MLHRALDPARISLSSQQVSQPEIEIQENNNGRRERMQVVLNLYVKINLSQKVL
jgi:hypothetical protein